MSGKRLLTAAGALVAVAIASGIAYAAIPGPGNVFAACMLKGVGTIRLIDKSLPSTSLLSHCTDKETELSWNQAGQPGPAGPVGPKGEPGAPGTNGTDGKDGVSVTMEAEPAGSNCLGGGIRLTALNGANYVCNGKDGKDGRDGVDGTNGTNGTNGVDGHDGQDGVSVTSAAEPAGANCTNGGSKFTAANGVTFACNGAPGGGGGPTGQDATSAFGTAELSVTPTASAAVLPGLTQTISVSTGTVVFVTTDGALLPDSFTSTAFSATDVFVTIDGQLASHGLYRRVLCPNVARFCSWSLSAALPLSQGSHTVAVQAAGAVGGFQGATTALVSGGTNSANQGALTVMVLKK